MKNTPRSLRLVALSAAFLLVLLAVDSYGSHLLIGLRYGYSSALTEVHYIESYTNIARTAPELDECRSISIGVVPDSSHVSFLGEWFTQRYGQDSAFDYFGLSVEYRFFKDIARTWNPYFSLGAFFLFYLDFGGGPPDYPKTTEVQAATGTRIRLAGPFYLNPQVAYQTGTSSISFQVGVDVIF